MAREQLNIGRTPGLDGFLYVVRWSTTPIELPLDAAPPTSPRLLLEDPSWTLLEVLDELADDGRLVGLSEGRHLLSWETLDGLTPDEWERLGLPEVTRPDIKLMTRHHITRDHYRIDATVHVPEYLGDLLTWGSRVGRHVTVGTGDGVLLDGTSTRLLDVLADGPGPTWEDRIAFTAEVKALADAAGAQLDTALSRNTITLVDDVDADVVTADDGSIEVTPRFHHGGFSDDNLRNLSDTKPYLRESDGRQVQHFVVSRRARQKYERARESAPRIPVNEVLSFLENPEAFIPEDWGIDLARFSERVKGLKPRAYRAQPFVIARDTHRGWFDVRAGVRLDPVASDDAGEGTQAGSPVPLDEYQQLVEEARQNGNSTLYRDGQWLQVPTDDNLIGALEQLQGSLKTPSNGPMRGQISGQIEASRLPFVLEIFTNIEDIEFNQPIIEARDHSRSHLETLPPDAFQADLAPYQLEAFRRMLEAKKVGLGLLLADEMGLGKTVQVLAALSHWKISEELQPSLIVVPLTLIENWVREAGRFAPNLRVHVHQGPARIKNPEYLVQFDLVLTPYETVLRDQLDLGRVDWQVVILDEAQQIKNASASRTSAIKALKAAHRLALTGTPVENNILDLWSICDFVQPGFLGSSREFARQYRPPATAVSEDEWVAHGDRLATLLRPIMMRRTKDEVALSLPPKAISERRVSLGPDQYRRYQQVASLVRTKALNPLEAINRLRTLSAHPLALDRSPNWAMVPPEAVPKLATTLDILTEIQQKDEKALIFCESRPVQEMLRYWVLRRFDRMAPILNGKTNHRQGMVDRFQATPGFGVMILSPKAGGVGLNIVGANHVIHYMRWWNPAVENQATDRAHRRGQTRPVTVYYPIATDPDGILTRGTVEEILDEVLREKSRLASQSLIPMRDDEIKTEVLERAFALR